MILVIDDREEIRNLLYDIIQDAGYYCDTAIDATSGFYKIRRVYYAMALVDIMLPDFSGMELAARVKALPRPFCQVPMVAMTGTAFSDPEGLFATVLLKPFLPRDLRDTITRFARPPIKDLHLSQIRA